MKYNLEVRIVGWPAIPTYTGNVSVWSNDPDPDFQRLAFEALKRSSFPELWLSAVTVLAIKEKE